MAESIQTIHRQTRVWLDEVVVGLKLCPFAAPVLQADQLSYVVVDHTDTEQHLKQLAQSFSRLDSDPAIETSLLIYADAYREFDCYLDYLSLCNQLLEDLHYSGIYQLASFHPDYRFEGSTADDAANFSNRSPYPMIHLLRESSIERAVSAYPDIESVPDRNIAKLHDIGFVKMKKKLDDIIS